MSKLSSLLKIFRRGDDPPQTAAEKAHDPMWEGRGMVDGKGLSPSGEVMDFERDSEPPK
jgi:hypothetical protein